jgi:hypothetical protein
MIPIGEPLHDLVRGLFSGKIEKELLDVLDFERSLLQAILIDEVFHGPITIRRSHRKGVDLPPFAALRSAGAARRPGQPFTGCAVIRDSSLGSRRNIRIDAGCGVHPTGQSEIDAAGGQCRDGTSRGRIGR